MTLLLFQDFVGILGKIAEQGTAILVLFLILVFVIVLITKILPAWERVKTAESNSREANAKALGELAGSLGQLAASQTQVALVVKEIAVEQRRSTDAVRILQRVNAESNESLDNSVNQLTETVSQLNERLDKLEENNAGK